MFIAVASFLNYLVNVFLVISSSEGYLWWMKNELVLGSQATITEILFVDENGDDVTLLELVNNDRADLRFGIDSDQEIYILTKADGKIQKVKRIQSNKS